MSTPYKSDKQYRTVPTKEKVSLARLFFKSHLAQISFTDDSKVLELQVQFPMNISPGQKGFIY